VETDGEREPADAEHHRGLRCAQAVPRHEPEHLAVVLAEHRERIQYLVAIRESSREICRSGTAAMRDLQASRERCAT
jgi:hypothetical protein